MPGVVRQGDKTAGHGCWPPTTPQSWSSNVFANGKPAVRKGDAIVPHTCPSIPETHGGAYNGAGRNVYVNGQEWQVQGDPVTCGDTCQECSGDIFCGG